MKMKDKTNKLKKDNWLDNATAFIDSIAVKSDKADTGVYYKLKPGYVIHLGLLNKKLKKLNKEE